MKNDTLSTLTGQIEKDNNFIKARRILVTLSIILIGLVTLGITVQEVNTFIFKLSIDNPQHLKLLFVISVVLSVIRYYSYAFNYQKTVKEIWCQKMLKDNRIFMPLDASYAVPFLSSGLLDVTLNDTKPINLKTIKYKAKFPLRRHVVYFPNTHNINSLQEHNDADNYEQRKISIYKPHNKLNLFNAAKVLMIEFKHRLELMFQSRVYFDINYPYYLATVSLALYIFHS